MSKASKKRTLELTYLQRYDGSHFSSLLSVRRGQQLRSASGRKRYLPGSERTEVVTWQDSDSHVGKIDDAFQTKDSRHTTLAAGPWLALRLRMESVETVGSFWTMRHNEERIQAAERTRNNDEEENTQRAEPPTANCQGDRPGQRETISKETCISQLDGQTTVGTSTNINKHLIQLPTHQVFTS